MAEDELIDQLRRWGAAKNGRRSANDDAPKRDDHVISRQRDMALAHKIKQEKEHEIVGRDGTERRRFMAERSGVKGLGIIPLWAVDPVRCRNDASPPQDREEVWIDSTPDDLLWIDRALVRLKRDYKIRALVLLEEFCEVGTHDRKAASVQKQYAGALSVRQYRQELKQAIEWMRTVREFMAA
jgi:hypothetical protein